MRKNFSESELNLYKTIDEILWKDWDPIGINEFEADARDEYYSYLPHIYEMTIAGASVAEIAEKLFNYESHAMEVRGSKQRCLSIAEKIVEAKNRFIA